MWLNNHITNVASFQVTALRFSGPHTPVEAVFAAVLANTRYYRASHQKSVYMTFQLDVVEHLLRLERDLPECARKYPRTIVIDRMIVGETAARCELDHFVLPDVRVAGWPDAVDAANSFCRIL